METLKGIPVASGIAIGQAFIYTKDLLIPKYSISDLQVNSEIDRFHSALKKTKDEFVELKSKMCDEMSEDQSKFLDSHILITEDTTFIKKVTEKIKEDKKNVEWIIFQVVDSIVKTFSKMEDEYFQDRAVDVLDIGRKVMQRLLAKKNISLSTINSDFIIISTDITVSDTASMNKKHILALVTEFGGKTAHAAILARALGIPSIFGIESVTHKINTGDLIIVDANKGEIFINPAKAKIDEYNQLKLKYEKKENETLLLKDLPTVTKDNKKIVLKANMEVPEQEIELIQSHGAEGIGLYRSEFLYLSKKSRTLPTEEQQFHAYKFILEKFPNHPVTIRTLDLGGDKVLHETNSEANPNLGWRAIRFCLARPDIFKTQLRALYRASLYGNLEIMFPMITGLEEILSAKRLINEVKKGLKKENIKFKENVPVGIMIETPSASLISDILAKHVDFFSIGTNDLIQYTLACDRGNEKVAYLYEPLHPAVLRLIKIVVDNAHKNKIKVSVCGEMASEIDNAIILAGLGIDELSMSTVCLLDVKKALREINYSEIKVFVEELLNLHTYNEVLKKVKTWLRKNLKMYV